MKKTDVINWMIEQANGFLVVKDAVNRGISRTHIANYIKEHDMEKVARGLYLANDAWEDPLYSLQVVNKEIIYSLDTALYLHGLTDREPFVITVTVKRGYNTLHLHNRGIRTYYVRKGVFQLGVVELKTNYGNLVRAYDKERSICDIIIHKKDLDIQMFQTAMKEYMASRDKNLHNLMRYAKELKIEEKVRQYTEVML